MICKYFLPFHSCFSFYWLFLLPCRSFSVWCQIQWAHALHNMKTRKLYNPNLSWKLTIISLKFFSLFFFFRPYVSSLYIIISCRLKNTQFTTFNCFFFFYKTIHFIQIPSKILFKKSQQKKWLLYFDYSCLITNIL